jgi:hypothetical protein
MIRLQERLKFKMIFFSFHCFLLNSFVNMPFGTLPIPTPPSWYCTSTLVSTKSIIHQTVYNSVLCRSVQNCAILFTVVYDCDKYVRPLGRNPMHPKEKDL